jgi:ATP-binding cassette subfamily B protein
VLENGRITEQGTHAELIENNGLYSKVYKLQSKLDSDGEEATA